MATSPVWSRSGNLVLPRLQGQVDADTCVVGLGASGLSCIEELLSLGERVVGVDAGAVGSGAAGRNGGLLLAGTAAFYHDAVERYGRERARAIYQHTMVELERTYSTFPGVAQRTGSLRVALSAEEQRDCDRQYEEMRKDGLPVARYDGPEGKGLLLPTDGVMDPLVRCHVLADRVTSAGGHLYGDSPVLDLTGTEVHTSHGLIRCRRVIVAVDGKLERLLPELEGHVRTARLQMLATAPISHTVASRPVYARWGYEYWQQLPDGRIAMGGFRDIGGEEEWTDRTGPSSPVQRALEKLLREDLAVATPITHRWGASVGFSSTGLPFIGEVRPGVWAIGGYSGTGNIIGTLCGRAIARLATGAPSPVAHLFRDAEPDC